MGTFCKQSKHNLPQGLTLMESAAIVQDTGLMMLEKLLPTDQLGSATPGSMQRKADWCLEKLNKYPSPSYVWYFNFGHVFGNVIAILKNISQLPNPNPQSPRRKRTVTSGRNSFFVNLIVNVI